MTPPLRTARVQIRVTAGEARRWHAAARAEGQTLTEWITEAIAGEERRTAAAALIGARIALGTAAPTDTATLRVLLTAEELADLDRLGLLGATPPAE